MFSGVPPVFCPFSFFSLFLVFRRWKTKEEKTETLVDENGKLKTEIPKNLTTWIFEDGSFVPQAKLADGKAYSIITDHLGTPFEAYNDKGKKVWSCELDIYGKVHKIAGERSFIPFRYQGQYEDEKIDLYYNRFRYYSPESGTYISQDPIGLAGGMPNMYSYVRDSNNSFDPLGLLETVIFTPDKVIAETTIQMQGANNLDFRAANSNVGLNAVRGSATGNAHKLAHGDVVWHHVSYDPVTNTARMQLVTSADHIATFPHKGAVAEFMGENEIEGKYGNTASKNKAKALNAKCH